jgi:opacity protein-like surface antigen
MPPAPAVMVKRHLTTPSYGSAERRPVLARGARVTNQRGGTGLRPIMIALMGLTFSLSALPAHAVDLPPAPILDDADEPSDAGLYLRGDIGVIDQLVTRGGRDPASTLPLVRSRFDRDVVIGGGLGYQLSPWFRTDVTVDHRFEAAFKGTRLAPATLQVLDRADFEATTLLVNGYVDLPLWSGVTPYVGAGIGASYNRLSDAKRQVSSDLISGNLPLPSRTETAFAWALMGGLAFDIGASFKIDLGYRYTHLGSARTHSTGLDAPIRAKDIDAHEFRVGARYMFD